jgi:hypothetical protein
MSERRRTFAEAEGAARSFQLQLETERRNASTLTKSLEIAIQERDDARRSNERHIKEAEHLRIAVEGLEKNIVAMKLAHLTDLETLLRRR